MRSSSTIRSKRCRDKLNMTEEGRAQTKARNREHKRRQRRNVKVNTQMEKRRSLRECLLPEVLARVDMDVCDHKKFLMRSLKSPMTTSDQKQVFNIEMLSVEIQLLKQKSTDKNNCIPEEFRQKVAKPSIKDKTNDAVKSNEKSKDWAITKPSKASDLAEPMEKATDTIKSMEKAHDDPVQSTEKADIDLGKHNKAQTSQSFARQVSTSSISQVSISSQESISSEDFDLGSPIENHSGAISQDRQLLEETLSLLDHICDKEATQVPTADMSVAGVHIEEMSDREDIPLPDMPMADGLSTEDVPLDIMKLSDETLNSIIAPGWSM